ncbi:MAG TPA: DUF6585 family protein [Anaerolineales bacterium]
MSADGQAATGPTARPSLGQPLHEHRAQAGLRRMNGWMAGVGVLGGGLASVVGIVRWSFAYSNYGPAVVWRWSLPWLLAGAPLLLVGLIGTIWTIRWSGLRVIAHQRGLRILRGSRELAVPWENVLHVYTSGVRYGVPGVIWGSRAALLLETSDRQRLRLSQAIEGLVELIQTVKRNVYPRLLASYTREYRSGKGLPFGPIRLTPQGVQKGRRSLGWGDLEAARIRDGRIEMKPKAGKRLGAIRASADSVPNVEICLQLVQHLIAQTPD